MANVERSVSFQIPQSDEEANEFILRFNNMLADAEAVVAHERETIIAKQQELEAMKAAAEEKIAPLRDAILQLHQGLNAWMKAHQDRLTRSGDTKSRRLPNGVVGLFNTPAALKVEDPDALIQLLKEKGLFDLIRDNPEPDKEAIKDRMKEDESFSLEGVSLTGNEIFYIGLEGRSYRLSFKKLTELLSAAP